MTKLHISAIAISAAMAGTLLLVGPEDEAGPVLVPVPLYDAPDAGDACESLCQASAFERAVHGHVCSACDGADPDDTPAGCWTLEGVPDGGAPVCNE